MTTTSATGTESLSNYDISETEGGLAVARDKPLVHRLYNITPEGYGLLTETDLWRRPVLPPNIEWVVGYTGPRGGGKSLEMAYIACRDYLIRGRPVWSNIPIKIELKLPNNEVVVAESIPLDVKSFFSLAEDLRGGLVCIDELELYAEARRSGSNKNLLLTYIIMQTRKRALSFFFTIQQPMWADNRLRFMSDIMIRSRDIAFTPWGFEKKINQGQYFSMVVEDWSGMLTGYRYQETGYTQTFCLWGVPVWGMYNSYDVVDVFDAMTPIDMNLNRMRISTGAEEGDGTDPFFDKVNDHIAALQQAGVNDIVDRELWKMMGLDKKDDRRVVGAVLKELGVTKKQRQDGYHYILPDYVGGDSNRNGEDKQ
jgi:hypothetical protein